MEERTKKTKKKNERRKERKGQKKESEEQWSEEDGSEREKNLPKFGTSQKALRNQTACSLWVLMMRLSSLSLSLAPASPDIFLPSCLIF
jgi:hypothetical protein